MTRVRHHIDSFAFWIVVAYFLLAGCGIAWTVYLVNRTEDRIIETQLASCERGNAIRLHVGMATVDCDKLVHHSPH